MRLREVEELAVITQTVGVRNQLSRREVTAYTLQARARAESLNS